MNNFMIGTAGHIDHGKTTLIKALSGITTDRLKEEQKRGISIVNGYAYIKYNDDYISIIDVPGHEKFIKNMLSGISGISYVIIVVAADESIMPQTIEHLDIIELLGIDKGVFVITKCDMVDKDFYEVVEEEIIEYKKDKVFKDFDILKVSSHTGEGIDELKHKIFNEYEKLEPSDINEYPRLVIDRSFVNKGVGTIVTGTLEANDLNINDEYMVYPQKKDIKIKNIQTHDKKVEIANLNSRVALNIDLQEVKRGDIISNKNKYDTSNSVIVELNILKKYEKFVRDAEFKFYFGSKELIGKLIHLKDNYYEMFFDEEYIFYYGQKGILRCMSPVLTIAGIKVLDPFAKKGRKNKLKQVIDLDMVIDYNSRLEYIMKKHSNGITKDRLEVEMNTIIKDLSNFIKIADLYFSENSINIWKDCFKSNLNNYFENNIYAISADKEEIKSLYYSDVSKKVYDKLIAIVIDEGIVDIKNGKITLSSREVNLSKEDQDIIEKIKVDYKNYKYTPQTNVEYSKKEKSLIKYLIDTSELIVVAPEMYYKKEYYFELKNAIINMLIEKNNISISDLKEKFDMSRKYSVPFLEHLDSIGLTERIDNTRVLKKGVVDGKNFNC